MEPSCHSNFIVSSFQQDATGVLAMQKRYCLVPYEVMRDPYPPGLPADELPNYVQSRAYTRRLSSCHTRRGVILGLLSLPFVCTKPANAQPVALIPALIMGVDLLSKTWDLFTKIRGQMSLGNGQNGNVNGAIEQAVKNQLFIESSVRIVVVVPGSADIKISFTGPAATTKEANILVSTSSVNQITNDILIR